MTATRTCRIGRGVVLAALAGACILPVAGRAQGADSAAIGAAVRALAEPQGAGSARSITTRSR